MSVDRSLESTYRRASDWFEAGLSASRYIAIAGCVAASFAIAAILQDPFLVSIPLIAAVLMVAMTQAVTSSDRPLVVGLFAWALFVRLLVIVALTLIDTGYAAGELLSPDGKGYLVRSRALVESHFAVGSPIVFFGSNDVGHYYLFGAVSALVGTQLIALELLTGSLSALTVPIAFAWARTVIPRHATLIAVLVAFSPGLILLSTANLLKDPAVLLATVTLLWAVARTLRSTTNSERVLWAALATVALTFLHVTRFYVAAYLEAGLVIALAFLVVRGGRRSAVLALAGVVLMAELLPAAAGWPPSPVILVAQIAHVGATPAMLGEAAAEDEEFFRRLPEWATVVVRPAMRAARRLFGPFVWVPPSSLDLRYLLGADFNLYPDTLLWYFVLPTVLLGLVWALRLLRREPQRHFEMGYLAIFLCVYLAQYFVINLSYRQREAILPLTLAFVPAGARWLFSAARGRLLYLSYWIILVVIAIAHVLLRATAG
jgi:hypothetical protein